MTSLGPAYSLIGAVDEDLEGSFTIGAQLDEQSADAQIRAFAAKQPESEFKSMQARAARWASTTPDGSITIPDARNPTGMTKLSKLSMTDLAKMAIWYENGHWYHRGIEFPASAVVRKITEFRANEKKYHDARMARGGNIFEKAGRTVNDITKAVGKVPVLGDVTNFAAQQAAFVTTPYRMAGGFVTGALTGGLQGGIEGAKKQAEVTIRQGKRYLASPLIRQGTKGLALLFPPFAPVAAGVEAANQLVKAIESGDPVAAAAAIATIATTSDMAAAGMPEAVAGMKFINDAKRVAGPVVDAAVSAGKVAAPMASKLGARFSIPPGATVDATIRAADNLLDNAAGKSGPAAAGVAQSVIKQTIAAAKVGDPDAKVAATTLAKVRQAQITKALKKSGLVK